MSWIFVKQNAGPWSPSTLSSLAAWFDAESIVQADDTEVNTWGDSSGNAYDLTGYGTTKPKFRTNVLNSLPVVRFNASGYMKRATWTGYPSNNSAITVAAVVKREASSTNGVFVSAGPSGNSRQDLIRVRNDNKFAMLRREASSNFRYADAGSTIGSGHMILLAGQNSSAEAFARYNGTVESIVYAGAYTNLQLTDVTPAYITIGAFSDAQSILPNNDEIAEVIVCDTELTVSDREKVEGYLAHKWGLTANLPLDHPYKTAAPTG